MGKEPYERSGSLWTPTRRELLGSLGVLGSGLLLPKPAKAANGFALVDHAGGYGTGYTMNSTGANLLVATVGIENDWPWRFSNDTYGNNWIKLTQYYAPYNNRSVALFYCANPKVGPNHRVNFSYDNPYCYMCTYIACFSGAQLVNPLDGAVGRASTSPGVITPAGGNELFVTGLATNDPVAPTIDASMILLGSNKRINSSYIGCGMAYNIQTAPASLNPTWSWVYNEYQPPAVAMASFKSSSVWTPASKVVHRVLSGG